LLLSILRTLIMNAVSNLVDKVMGKKQLVTPMKPKTDPNKKMHAVVWNGTGEVEYVQVPKPIITDSTDIILRVAATTVCGSDLHMYSGNIPTMHKGDILGHEAFGIVEDIGSEIQNIKVGDRVVVAFNIACGKCEFCQRQEYSVCKTTNPSNLEEYMYGHRTCAIFGYSHLTGGVPGAQAEYLRVPFADFNCLHLPDTVSDEIGALLADVIPTALFGVDRGNVKPGSTVVIWGLGPIGLMAAKWSQIRGASRVIGIDCVQDRFDVAHKALGIETINYKEVNVVKRLYELFPDGVDVGIECAGFEYAKTWKHKIEMAVGIETDTADILTEIIKSVRGFGTVSILGVYAGTTNHFPIGALMEKGLTVRSGQSPTQKY